MLCNKHEGVDIKHYNDLKVVIKYSNDINFVYENIEEYNLNKECKILIVFDAMIADLLSNKNIQQIVTKFFIRGRKINISLAFIKKNHFPVPRNIALRFTHYFIMKIHSKLVQ